MMPLLLKRLSHLTTALLLLVVAGALTAQDEGTKPKPEKGAGKKPKEKVDGKVEVAPAEPAPVSQGLLPFGKMLPVGEKHLGLEIPSFKDGIPSSTVRASSMTRVDDESMFLERMDIKMYGPPDQSEKDMRVMMKTATYHMPTQILASDERSRISRADFDLQGDSLVFDTVTGQGKMVGHVQMVIHDGSSLMKPKEPEVKGPGADKEKEKAKDKPAEGKPGETASTPPPATQKKEETKKAASPPTKTKK